MARSLGPGAMPGQIAKLPLRLAEADAGSGLLLARGSVRRAAHLGELRLRDKGMEKCSGLFDEAVHDLLLPSLVEIDRELIAIDLGHAAIAEFLVEHAHADG